MRTRLLAAVAVCSVLAAGLPGVAHATAAAGGTAVQVSAITSDGEGNVSVQRVVTTSGNAAAVMDRLDNNPDVVSVEVDKVVSTLGTDPGRPYQWGLDVTTAEAARTLYPGTGVAVAVIDTGVSATIAADVNGAQLLDGYDFVLDTPGGHADGNGHGSWVATVIAAQVDNSTGIAGVSPDVAILPVRVLDDSGSGWTSSVNAGIIWAADNGADVINLSLGSTGICTVAQQTAIDYARTAGAVVVAASGNEGTSQSVTPAACTGVIGVGAIDENLDRAWFSSYGPNVDLVAPGVNVPVGNNGSWGTLDGTSFAAPFVSASAALARAASPATANTAIEWALTSTAMDLGTTGRDNDYGHGLVDPAATVRATAGQTLAHTTLVDAGPAGTTPGTPVTLTATLTANGSPVGYQTVDMFVATLAAPRPVKAATVVTGLNGIASFTVSPTATSGYYFRFSGADGLTGALSDGHLVASTSTASTLTLDAPASVVGGTAARLTATLLDGASPATGRLVVFQAKYPTNTTWSTMGSAATDASGVAAKDLTLTSTMQVRAVFAGAVDLVPVTSPTSTIAATKVTAAIAVSAPSPVQAGTKVPFTITVNAAGAVLANQSVTLQTLSAGVWKTAGSGRLDASGTATVQVTPAATTSWRAVAATTAGYTTVTSEPVTVEVGRLQPVLTLTGPTAPLAGARSTYTLTLTGGQTASKRIALQYWTGTAWSPVATAVTTTAGIATASTILRSTGTYRAYFAGDIGLTDAASPSATLTVTLDTPTATMTGAGTTVSAVSGTPLTLTGALATGAGAAMTRTSATLQKYVAATDTWTAVGSATSGTTGTLTRAVATTAVATTIYRWLLPATTTRQQATSEPVTVNVTAIPAALAASSASTTETSGTITATLTRSDTSAPVTRKYLVLEQDKGTGWVMVRRTYTSTGTVVWTGMPNGTYRVVFAADATTSPASSDTVLVQWTPPVPLP